MTTRGTKVAFWSVAIALGLIRAWTMRHLINPDGISYLDMGDAFWRGDWSAAINAYWSPMYSWLTGLVLLVFRPSPYWEFAAVQGLNLVVYICVLACFGFFWREVLAWQKRQTSELSGHCILPWPDGAWMLLGYSIAAWAGLRLIGVETTNSDMLLAGFVYLAAGLVVRIRRGLASWSNFALLGFVLGLGYLAKSPMFPLAFVFLGVAACSATEWKKGVPRGLLALVVFLMVAGPLVISLSRSRGHFTFGESGRVNYAMLYQEMQWPLAHKSGDIQDLRPEAPLPIEVATLKGITYLHFYDHTRLTPSPTLRPTLQAKLGRYLKIWGRSLNMYYDLFVLRQGHLLAGVVILFHLGPGLKSSLKNIFQSWHVLIPTCTALAAYGTLVVEFRYVGPFVAMLWGGILPAIRFRDSVEFRRLPNLIAVIVAILFAIQLFGYVGRDVAEQPGDLAHPQFEIAHGLQELGLQPGDRVGVMGRSQRAYWARLARLSIAAEIRPAGIGTFWSASPESRKKSLDAFARAGAKAVVIQIEQPPDVIPENWKQLAVAEGWRRLGNTDKYAYILPR